MDDLVYHPLVDRRHNRAGSQVTRRYGDELVFRIFKCFSRMGILPPIRFDMNPTFGVFLRAGESFKKYTVVGEYTGVVEAMRWNISAALQPSDSVYVSSVVVVHLILIKDLLVVPNSRRSLCIVPEPYTGYGGAQY
eukprot:Gregarina_sp_Poly_1__726@NODE_1173_length_4867_cov_47_652708_g804_i0_p6_GENE_NODE_1173_length_4867_cov_47_652708_g804_i0NODE_1173_length_4867_cov_47_652708_g804_i0_p6_ORF_typecomplete_len136_score5_65_NODE_1173_length_4867_cov_47_652708_g804_i044014808